MRRLGFCSRWIELLMHCMESVEFSVLINGVPGPSFKPNRGLRQGDPLSPYIFLFCSEGFSALLTREEEKNHFSGYRGLPSQVNRNRCQVFNSLKDRLWKALQGWKGKLFSLGGKEILIKAVAQENPLAKLETPLCKKGSRGHGIQGYWNFNQAMLAKQSWRILRHPTSPLVKTLRGKYFRTGSFLKAKLGNSPSYAWRSILWERELFEKGYQWRVGNGYSISIGLDSWIHRDSPYRPVFTPSSIFEHLVAWLMTERGRWNEHKIRDNFIISEAEQILKIPLPREDYG
ncbi:uncharacterized protein LOC111014663 [Momordica charantia]|uniref:Uncharacterized protein LOC111014663 n=1 Tax=Momordica charantia TaxID=3673 RepID=A0A6J1CUD6_MOMCH|nr:uncharacterized protein LOC111014663 [Momordica charantia]